MLEWIQTAIKNKKENFKDLTQAQIAQIDKKYLNLIEQSKLSDFLDFQKSLKNLSEELDKVDLVKRKV